MFMVAGGSSSGTNWSTVAVSPDGISWTPRLVGSSSATTYANSIGFLNGQFVIGATGTSSLRSIYTTKDGVFFTTKAELRTGSGSTIMVLPHIGFVMASHAGSTTSAGSELIPTVAADSFKIPVVLPTSNTDGDYYIKVA
jgi:hypothetical protein